MTPQKARGIILDLVDAGRDGAQAEIQDGGVRVDIVYSRQPGKEKQVMSLKEAEERMDLAIRAAWKALTGEDLVGDPVEEIQKERDS